MNRRHLLLLYPRRWRDRYQREFEALLSDTDLKRADYFDVIKGAVSMRMIELFRRPAWQAIGLLTLVGLLMGAVATRTMRIVYISTAVLQLSGDKGELTNLQPAIEETLSRKQLSSIMNDLDLYTEERKHKPLEDVVLQMRHDTRAGLESRRPDTISVAFAHSDPRAAQRVTKELVAALLSSNNKRRDRQQNVTVIDPGDLPLTPVSPNVRAVLSAGAICGLLAGASLAALTARLRRLDHHSA